MDDHSEEDTTEQCNDDAAITVNDEVYYKVSQKKWDLLLLLQVVNPTFFGTPCS